MVYLLHIFCVTDYWTINRLTKFWPIPISKIARCIYQCKKLNRRYYNDYIQWILFDEFKNIEYLAKGGFGEVHKATWINDIDVVLKRIYNNSNDDKIVDILNEVK